MVTATIPLKSFVAEKETRTREEHLQDCRQWHEIVHRVGASLPAHYGLHEPASLGRLSLSSNALEHIEQQDCPCKAALQPSRVHGEDEYCPVCLALFPPVH